MLCKHYLPFLKFPLHFVNFFFCCTEFIKRDTDHLFIFAFVVCAFVPDPKNHCQDLVRAISPMLSSRGFMVSGLMFKFESILN